MFLTNLLPGLRELRAPLAAGYTTMLAVFLIAGGKFMPEGQATGVLGSFFDVSNAIGQAAAFAAITFAAYLIGALLADIGRTYFNRRGRAIGPLGRQLLTDLAYQEATAADALRTSEAIGPEPGGAQRSAQRALRRPEPDQLQETWLDGWWRRLWEARKTRAEHLGWRDWIESWFRVSPGDIYPDANLASRPDVTAVSRVLANETYQELGVVHTRLMATESALYGAVDRLHAEVELRQALALPLGLLALAFLMRGPAWAAIAPAIVGVALPPQAARRRRDANELLAQALWLGRVESPTLETFRQISGVAAAREKTCKAATNEQ